jgi:hypothetical protein
MNKETILIVISVAMFFIVVIGNVLYFSVILPALRMNGDKLGDHPEGLPSNQFRQYLNFIKISKEKSIHENARITIYVIFIGIPMLIVLLIIMMFLN